MHGYGAGATPTDLWGSRSLVTIHEFQIKLQESEKKREESDEKVKYLEAKIEHVEQLLEQLLGVQMQNTTANSSYSVDAATMVYNSKPKLYLQ